MCTQCATTPATGRVAPGIAACFGPALELYEATAKAISVAASGKRIPNP
jgi:hypothetical protein